MKKARYKYRVEVNRWTWLAGISFLIFLGVLLVQILRNPPIFFTKVEVEAPQGDVVLIPVDVYDPIEGTGSFDGMSLPPAGPETSYDPIVILPWPTAVDDDTTGSTVSAYEEEWYPPDLITAAPEPMYAPVIAEPIPVEEPVVVAEATAAQKTLIERVLELISQILDKLVQLATTVITLVGIWKSIKREERKDESEPKEDE